MGSKRAVALFALAVVVLAAGAADAAATKGAQLDVSTIVCSTTIWLHSGDMPHHCGLQCSRCTGSVCAYVRRYHCPVLCLRATALAFIHAVTGPGPGHQYGRTGKVEKCPPGTAKKGPGDFRYPGVALHVAEFPASAGALRCPAHTGRHAATRLSLQTQAAVIIDAQVQGMLGQEFVPGPCGPNAVRVIYMCSHFDTSAMLSLGPSDLSCSSRGLPCFMVQRQNIPESMLCYGRCMCRCKTCPTGPGYVVDADHTQ